MKFDFPIIQTDVTQLLFFRPITFTIIFLDFENQFKGCTKENQRRCTCSQSTDSDIVLCKLQRHVLLARMGCVRPQTIFICERPTNKEIFKSEFIIQQKSGERCRTD